MKLIIADAYSCALKDLRCYPEFLRWFIVCFIAVPAVLGFNQTGTAQTDDEIDRILDAASVAYEDEFYLDVISWASPLLESTNKSHAENTKRYQALLLLANAHHQVGNLEKAHECLNFISSHFSDLPSSYFRSQAELSLSRGDYLLTVSSWENYFKKLNIDSTTSSKNERESYLTAHLQAGLHAKLEDWFQSSKSVGFLDEIKLTQPNEYVDLKMIQAESYFQSAQFQQFKSLSTHILTFRLSPYQLWSLKYLELLAELESDKLLISESIRTRIESLRSLALASGKVSSIWKTRLAESVLWQSEQDFESARDSLSLLLESNIPDEFRSEAILNMAQTYLYENKFEEALEWLEQFSSSRLNKTIQGWVWLTEAQIHFHHYQALKKTNAIVEARESLVLSQNKIEEVVNLIPGSDLGSHARFHLGWCLLESGSLLPAREEFVAASSLFPPGGDQLEAKIKVGDINLRLNQAPEAIIQFEEAAQLFQKYRYGDQTLFRRLQQATVDAYLKANRMQDAETIIQAMLKEKQYGESEILTIISFAQYLSNQTKQREAYDLLIEVREGLLDFELAGLVDENIIHQLIRLRHWEDAEKKAQQWVTDYSTHPHLADVMYQLCYLVLQLQGDEAALSHFVRFKTKFPSHKQSSTINYWIAEFFYSDGDFFAARREFEEIVSNPEVTNKNLVWESRIKICLCLMHEEKFGPAITNTLGVIGDIEKVLSENSDTFVNKLHLRSYLVLADIHQRNTSSAESGIQEALNVLNTFLAKYSTHEMIDEVRNYSGRLILKVSSDKSGNADIKNLNDAEQLFLLTAKSTSASDSLRAEAEIGLAIIDEKRAEFEPDNKSHLRNASAHYRKVFYSQLQETSPFWVKKAGASAIQLAQRLGEKKDEESLQNRWRLLFGEKNDG